MKRKLIAYLFALVSFNLIFFLFLKSHLGQLLWFRWGSIQIAALFLSFVVFQFLAYWPGKSKQAKQWALVSAGVAAVASLWSILVASPTDQTLLYLLAFGGALVSFYSLAYQTGFIQGLLEIVTLPLWLLLGAIESLGKTKENINELKSATSFLKIKGIGLRKDIVWPVFWGVVLAVPVLLIISSLLSSGDPIFAKYLSNFFKWDWSKMPWWIANRVFLTFIFGLVVIPWTYVRIKNKFNPPGQAVTFANFGITVSVVVGAVALLLGIFIVIEFPYVFTSVAETELAKFGVKTFSEYVTRGFVELLVVSLIVFVVSTTALMVYKKATRAGATLRLLNLVLLGEALVFIISILRRVYMYQEFHGLTRVRVYGSTFLILLIVLTLILMARHARARVEWFIWETAAIVAWVFMTVSLNTDNLIANHYRPTVNKEIDYVYIARMSPEAYGGWVKSYEDAKAITDKLYNDTLGRPLVDMGLSDEDKRKLTYAHITLNTLRRELRNLTFYYGTNEEINDMRIGWKFRKTDPKEVNLKERMIYQRLRDQINFKELIEAEEKSYKLYSQFIYAYGAPSGGRHAPGGGANSYQKVRIDRSLDSPFVEDVELSR